MKVYVFPGQGSQHKGMGEDLFGLFPDHLAYSDKLLGYSVKDLCLNNKESKLNLTQYTQPLLFIVNTISYLHKISGGTASADFFAGHSLGEYNALFAASVFDFETGLKIVKKRGELMARANNGGMAAIVNISATELQSIIVAHDFPDVDIANFNSPIQTVISGPHSSLKAVRQKLNELSRGLFIDLPVSAPFHSRYMKDISEEFSDYLMQFTFGSPEVPVISNVTAQPYQSEKIIDLLTKQLYSPVCWTNTISNLIKMNVFDFEEVGPGQVLSKLIRQIISDETENNK